MKLLLIKIDGCWACLEWGIWYTLWPELDASPEEQETIPLPQTQDESLTLARQSCHLVQRL